MSRPARPIVYLSALAILFLLGAILAQGVFVCAAGAAL
jgi:hypothetical protein